VSRRVPSEKSQRVRNPSRAWNGCAAPCTKSEGLPSVTILADKPPGFVDKEKMAGGIRRSQHQRSLEVTETCQAKPGSFSPVSDDFTGDERKAGENE
jgi:hypothetical protein